MSMRHWSTERVRVAPMPTTSVGRPFARLPRRSEKLDVASGRRASLCEMGCIRSIGRDGGDADGTLQEIRDDLRTQRSHRLKLGARDAAVVDELFGASNGGGQTETKRSIGVSGGFSGGVHPFTAQGCRQSPG
jgi:hypothetical protein